MSEEPSEAEHHVALAERVERSAVTAGQRRVNILWEVTQAAIAVAATMGFLYVSIQKIDAPDLRNAFFLIVGFYFSRTNHVNTGGVGRKTTDGR